MTCTILSNGTEKNWQSRNEHEQPYISLKMFLLQRIRQLYTDGYTDFCINCEEGFPLWAGEIVCLLKKTDCTGIRLHVVIPYEEQSTTWQEELRDRYFSIHEQADSITQAGTHFDENCYLRAEKILAAGSDLVLLFGDKEDYARITGYEGCEGLRVELLDSRQFNAF